MHQHPQQNIAHPKELDDEDEFELPRYPCCPNCLTILRIDEPNQAFYCETCQTTTTHKELHVIWRSGYK